MHRPEEAGADGDGPLAAADEAVVAEAQSLLAELDLAAVTVPSAASPPPAAWLAQRTQRAGADAAQLEHSLAQDLQRLRLARTLLARGLAHLPAQQARLQARLQQAQQAHAQAHAQLEARLQALEANVVPRGAPAAAQLIAADQALSRAREAQAVMAAFHALAAGRSWPSGDWVAAAPLLRRLAVLTAGASGPRAAAVRGCLPGLRDQAEATLQQQLQEAAAARDATLVRQAYGALRALVGAEAAWRPHVARLAALHQSLLPARLRDPAAVCCRALAAKLADDACATVGIEPGRPLVQALDEVARDLTRDIRLLEPLADDRPAAAQHLLASVAAQTGTALLAALRAETSATTSTKLLWLHALPLALHLLSDWLMLLLPLTSASPAAAAATVKSIAGSAFEPLLEQLFANERAGYLEGELSWFADFASASLANEPLDTKGERARWWTLGASSNKQAAPGAVSVETALLLLHASEAAQARAKIFSSALQLPSASQQIFSALLQHLGHRYLAGHVERSIRRLVSEQQTSKSNTPLTVPPAILDALAVVQAANHVVLLLEKHFNQTVAPVVQASVNEETNCQMSKNAVLSSLEERIITALENVLAYTAVHTERLLTSYQKKSDWKVKPEEEEALEIMEARPSKACLSCIEFLKELHKVVTVTLDGTNLGAFVLQLGTRVHKVLVAHILQFQISVGIGGMKLLRDITTCKELLTTWNQPDVTGLFAQLHELAKVFLLPPSNLRHLLQQSELHAFTQSDILSFVKLRTDYSSSWLGKYL